MSKALTYRPLILLLAVLIALPLLSGCSSRRNTTATKPSHRGDKFLTKRLAANQIEYDWLSAKVATKLEIAGKTHRFKSTVRVRHDSCIWISMSPALGVEAARVVITPDSLKFLNRLDKTYYIATMEELSKKLNMSVSFELLEDFVAGNAVAFDFDEGKYKASIDTANLYLLTSKNPRIVRTAIETDEEKLRRRHQQDSITGLGINGRRMERAMERSTEDELYLLRYWLEPEAYKLQKVMVHDLRTNSYLEIAYDDHKEVAERILPHKSELFVTDRQQEFRVSFNYSKVKFDQPQSFPFKITSKYEQIVY